MNTHTGFTGISFPFRIGVRGGVVLSSTSVREVPHIIESIKQRLTTSQYERTMEHHIYSEIDTSIFEPNDVSTHTLLQYQIKNALEQEDRIKAKKVEISQKDNTIFVTITFTVIAYNSTYTTTIKVGDLDATDN